MPRTRRQTLKDKPEKVVYESTAKYKVVKAKNQEQYNFLKCIREKTVSIALGIAGTGKSHIACGAAAELLISGHIETIVIIRPALECGQSMGMIPGTIDDKVGPYMNPLLTELGYFLNTKELLAQGKLAIQALGYARGMTFLNSLVIIDEVQSIDERSLKMILSRIGAGSKYVIIGDDEQSDLKHIEAAKTAEKIDQLIRLSYTNNEIGYVELLESVRHPLIKVLLSIWN